MQDITIVNYAMLIIYCILLLLVVVVLLLLSILLYCWHHHPGISKPLQDVLLYTGLYADQPQH